MSAIWLKYGSQGEQVKDLQTKLNAQGYSVAVDGVYGSQTQSAVKNYQSKTGNTVDGIVGDATWSALTNASNAQSTPQKTETGVSEKTQQSVAKYTNGYTPSETVINAQKYLEEQLKNKPGQYNSKYDGQIQEIYNKLMNREEFNYDLNGDMLYQQYKDQYQNQGRLAMENTMGQAAGLTGGYGSTYSQSAGQQAYNGYLQQLNNRVPELYQMALSKYQQEGSDMYDRLSATVNLDNAEYGRYRDGVEDYYSNLSNAYDMYSGERSYDYNDFATMLSYWQNQMQAEQEQANWQAEMDFSREQYEYSKAKANSSGGSKSTSKSKSSSASKTYDGLTADDIYDKVKTLYTKMTKAQAYAVINNGTAFTPSQQTVALAIFKNLAG